MRISGEGKIYTYGWMRKNAKVSIETARRTNEGRFFSSMNTLVFSAFAMEAFFNHLGLELIEDWEIKERRLSKLKKLNLFLSKFNIEADLKSRPFISVLDAFKFRDLLAHGRTETVIQDEEIDISKDELRRYTIENEWMKLCNLETAERVFVDVEKLIHILFKAAGMGEYPFMHLHNSTYSARST